MPLASVDDKGTQLYYEDSGPPREATTYATLVLIHGTIFHSGNFRPLLAFAAEDNLRLVAINLRHYPGSTPLSLEERDALYSDRESQASFIRDRGLEIATFLEWFIRNENIPKKAPSTTHTDGDLTAGGISILGWSSGNCTSLSLLAHANCLSKERQDLLNAYLRSIIIYDPSYHVFGIPPPSLEQAYGPLRDTTVPPEKAPEMFSNWVSGYFSHSPSLLSSFATLDQDDFFAGLAQTSIADPPPHQQPTLERMFSAEVAAVTDWGGASAAHIPMSRIDSPVYSENVRRALHDAIIWPELRVTLVWCDMSVGETLLGSWHLAIMVQQSWPTGARRVDVIRMENRESLSALGPTYSNHPAPFIHYLTILSKRVIVGAS